jgi:uracil-DNA glycosylase family 4
VGRSGRRLDQAIAEVGLRDGEFGILNVVKCRPPGNRFLSEAARKCRPFLERQLGLLEPKVIVTLGAHALAAIDPTAPAVTVAAGRERRWGTTPLFPLLHPAAALHAPKYRDRWEADLGALSKFLSGPPGGG